MTSPAPPLSQQRMHVDVIKQHTGPVQVTRRVQVDIPGKHFPGLQAAEQSAVYKGTAVEYKERHKFAQHAKAWGAAHAGPGIRFVCESDALDDPDHKGFWTTLALWNRWRHDPDAEKQFLDALPTDNGDWQTTAAVATTEKAPPSIKKHFAITGTGQHTFGGSGPLKGTWSFVLSLIQIRTVSPFRSAHARCVSLSWLVLGIPIVWSTCAP